eukprot:12412266-Heterocapsa_arctica.AAC.1
MRTFQLIKQLLVVQRPTPSLNVAVQAQKSLSRPRAGSRPSCPEAEVVVSRPEAEVVVRAQRPKSSFTAAVGQAVGVAAEAVVLANSPLRYQVKVRQWRSRLVSGSYASWSEAPFCWAQRNQRVLVAASAPHGAAAR